MNITVYADDRNRVHLSLRHGNTVVTWQEECTNRFLQTLAVLNKDYYTIFARILKGIRLTDEVSQVRVAAIDQRVVYRDEQMQQEIPHTTLGLWFPTIPYRTFFLGPKNCYMEEQSKLFVSDNKHCIEDADERHRCALSLIDDESDDWCVRTTWAAFTQLYMSMINPRRPRVAVNTAMEAWEVQGTLRMPIIPDSVKVRDEASQDFTDRIVAKFVPVVGCGVNVATLSLPDDVAIFEPSPDRDRLIGLGCMKPLPTRCLRKSSFWEGSLEKVNQLQPVTWTDDDRCWMALPHAEEVEFDVGLEEMEGILKVFTESGKVYPRVRTLIFRSSLILQPHVLTISHFFPRVECVRHEREKDMDETEEDVVNRAGVAAFGLLWHPEQ